MSGELIERKGTDSLNSLEEGFNQIVAGIAGLIASGRGDYIISMGRILQRKRGRHFFTALKEEWNVFVDKGKIKEDYSESEQCEACLQELLDCLDNDSPDEIRFSVLKKLFLSVATEGLSNRDDVLPQQYIRIARTLDSGQVLLLLASLKAARNDRAVIGRDYGTWLERVKAYSGLRYTELIQSNEEGLVSKRLLMPLSSIGGMNPGEHARLTSLGLELCRFIEHYDQVQSDLKKEG